MKAELILNQIKSTSNTSLGVDVCHIKLTLKVELVTIKCDLSSTGISELKINSSHTINELRTLIEWLDEEDRKAVSNNSKVRQFIKEKLDAHKTLNSKKSIGLG